MTPLPPVQFAQRCATADCHWKGRVQAETPTGTPLRCQSCDVPMNAVRIPSTMTIQPAVEAKPCRWCRARPAESDLGNACDPCYIARHRDFENGDWLDEADERFAVREWEASQ